MKILLPFALASVSLVSACASSSQNDADTPRTPVAVSSSTSEREYTCESGETIVATYSTTDSATIRYQGSSHDMQVAVSGSGARYVGDDLEWWTKGSGPGSEGNLFRHMADGTSGNIVETCSES